MTTSSRGQHTVDKINSHSWDNLAQQARASANLTSLGGLATSMSLMLKTSILLYNHL